MSSSQSASWQQSKQKSQSWFQKIGNSVNKASNKLGAEAFWPTGLDKEADKAAKILRSFCIDGFATDQHRKEKKALDRIPPEVIRNARGLAVFTVLRAGLHWSGAGGSGVLISRLPDGSWSAPSGILVHTLGWGLIAGADIYDCVCVINSEKGMQGFTKTRCTLGGEVSAAVGPLGGAGKSDLGQAAVWTYTKSKGLYVGVQVDGTVISERTAENERFYGVDKLKNTTILAGHVSVPSGSMAQLWETLQAAEGAPHNESALPPPYEPSPGDRELDLPRTNSEKEYNEFADPREHVNTHS
ncbi:hypothetical protein MBLNU459_g5515t2 [Dothideomycetes sp. NU459]